MVTVKTARQQVYGLIRKANDAYDPLVLDSINAVLERFHTMGKWKGSFVEVALTSYDGVITLPRQCETLLFFRKNSAPYLIKSQWFEWLQWGIGYRSQDHNLNHSYDQGSGFCSFRDFAEPRKLRVKTVSSEDNAISVTFQGIESNGRKIYTEDTEATHPVNGETVTLSGSSGDTTNTFANFTGFIKPVTHQYIEVWTINPDDNSDETLIGLYEPGEEVADYRRYKVGTHDDTVTLYGLCKLRYMSVASEQDLIIPPNMGALKNGIMALQFEEATEIELANQYWGQAFAILNSALNQDRGGANAPLVIDYSGARQRNVPCIY